MRRSVLEIYVNILAELANNGPLKVTHVMYQANLNSDSVKEKLRFLMKQNLVEERLVHKKANVYLITQRGIAVLKSFREIRLVLPTIDEQKNYVQSPLSNPLLNQ
jgi:predicted transcriptional regulator